MTLIPMGGQRFLPNPALASDAPGTYLNMGLTAERLAERHSIARETQDAFAYASHKKALAALETGKFVDEIVPVKASVSTLGPDGKPNVRETVLERDEGPRADTTLEALAKLKPAFKADGTVT